MYEHEFTASDILAMDDIVIEEVVIPEWKINGKPIAVEVKSLTSDEKDKFDESITEIIKDKETTTVRTKYEHLRAKLVVLTAVKNGKPLFKPADVIALGKKNGKAVDRLFTKARELSGMTADVMEKLVENFESAQTDSENSDSQNNVE